ncbi:E3 ubiquitin-protein ligase MARCH3 [Elysia marginata]|uniref:E3 ubiquitin-protein ligase MARCH3 n=1 Tax=Elysia marginata TaxID=1093978 RepID=A0AAV4JCW4_9GAST|nr:E3 ubiquitin-protein ligase MARCH3 [Elysia marginata]
MASQKDARNIDSYDNVSSKEEQTSHEQLLPHGCSAIRTPSGASVTEWDTLLTNNAFPETTYPEGLLAKAKLSEETEKGVIDSSKQEITPKTSTLAVEAENSPWPGDDIACRICQDGDFYEKLISPCLCSGTVGFVHISCLNTWLQVTSRTSCELCGFPFPVKKKRAPLSEYLRNPRANMDIPNLACDIACLVVLTPLLFASVYLSCTGALRYESLGQAGSLCAVVTLLVALILVYLSWAALAIVYHVRVWRAWREKHSSVSMLQESQLLNFHGTTKKARPRRSDRKHPTGRWAKYNPNNRHRQGGRPGRARERDTEILLAPITLLSGWIRVNNRVAVRSHHPA